MKRSLLIIVAITSILSFIIVIGMHVMVKHELYITTLRVVIDDETVCYDGDEVDKVSLVNHKYKITLKNGEIINTIDGSVNIEYVSGTETFSEAIKNPEVWKVFLAIDVFITIFVWGMSVGSYKAPRKVA